jgi:hypothetical protein
MGRVRFGPFMREMRHFPTFVRLGWGQTTLTAMDANTINVGTSHRPPEHGAEGYGTERCRPDECANETIHLQRGARNFPKDDDHTQWIKSSSKENQAAETFVPGKDKNHVRRTSPC